MYILNYDGPNMPLINEGSIWILLHKTTGTYQMQVQFKSELFTILHIWNMHCDTSCWKLARHRIVNNLPSLHVTAIEFPLPLFAPIYSIYTISLLLTYKLACLHISLFVDGYVQHRVNSLPHLVFIHFQFHEFEV